MHTPDIHDLNNYKDIHSQMSSSLKSIDSKYKDVFNIFMESVFRQGGVEAMANSLPFVIGAFVVSVDGKVVAANESFLDMVGYTRNELYKKSVTNLILKQDQEMVLKRIRENNPGRYKLRLLTKESNTKYTTVSPLIINIDNVTYRLAEFIDNTPTVNVNNNIIIALQKTAFALTSTIEKRDPYTVGHMSRTAAISTEIAKLLGLNQESIDMIQLGASIHDIGKISVPTEILTKPSTLETFEWEFIKRHPVVGYEILGEVDFDEKIKNIVLLHHEHQDGSGYPYGLIGSSIPIEVSIVAVADSLEAIAGVRPYRQALSFKDAIEIMKQEPNKYHHPSLSAACTLVEDGRLNGKEFGLH